MALGDVRDFVRDDACEFRLVTRGGNEAGVNGDESPGHGKGVERVVLDQVEAELSLRLVAVSNKRRAEPIEIGVEFQVVYEFQLCLDLAHELPAELLLLGRGQHRGGIVAQIR